MHKAFPLPVIEFGDSYKVPTNTDPNDTTTKRDADQSRRTITFTIEDIQKKKNDVKARTTLLLSLPDEYHYKKRKKNLLKQQYGNFKAKGTETLGQTFNRLQVIRNRNDLDSMSLDDLYNHLKVYEADVQKKSNLNSQDMAFISSSKNINNEDGNTSNGSTIKFEDSNQIDKDDMEEMDIKWNMALLSMRADKF
nr:hypothetical protein [Tanacetum cinerariifolium]GEV75869.1 hypothetical protein [Tanacetum cinerariifolium]